MNIKPFASRKDIIKQKFIQNQFRLKQLTFLVTLFLSVPIFRSILMFSSILFFYLGFLSLNIHKSQGSLRLLNGHLDISQATTAESAPLHIASDRTQAMNP